MINLLLFLRNGKYATPLDRLVQMRMVSSTFYIFLLFPFFVFTRDIAVVNFCSFYAAFVSTISTTWREVFEISEFFSFHKCHVQIVPETFV